MSQVTREELVLELEWCIRAIETEDPKICRNRASWDDYAAAYLLVQRHNAKDFPPIAAGLQLASTALEQHQRLVAIDILRGLATRAAGLEQLISRHAKGATQSVAALHRAPKACRHEAYRVVSHPDGGEAPWCPTCDRFVEL